MAELPPSVVVVPSKFFLFFETMTGEILTSPGLKSPSAFGSKILLFYLFFFSLGLNPFSIPVLF